MVTHDPPTLSIACTNGLACIKDTTNNIKSGNGFTVNIISEPFAQQANACSINTPEKMSEWPVSGLTKEPSVRRSILVPLIPSLIFQFTHSAAPRKGSSRERERV
jgi:flavin reductase (DIM6/NTAB) family NADH-FMN oxidoreductase RutF